MKYYTLKVIKLHPETTDTITVAFKQPGLKKIKYLPGQYLTLIFRINGRRYARPYSFSSAPLVDDNLEITIKRVPKGVVSNHIFDRLNVGDLVEVMEPMGNFILNQDLLQADTHLVLWGAGSGITPLMSILKYALQTKIVSHISLVYGNKDKESTIFESKITALKQEHQNFSAWHFFTRAKIAEQNPSVIEGRIDPNKVLSIIRNEELVNNTLHYICGPTGLKESIKSELMKLGVEETKIHSEDFEVVRDPAEFKEIVTRTVVVRKKDHDHFIEVAKGKSLLEAALDGLIDLPYSCQTGNCLVCKGRLLGGAVKMIGVGDSLAGLQSYEYLLCSSFPLTDDVVIEV